MRADALDWTEPKCEVCSAVGYARCQRGLWGRLHIVEEFTLDGSHIIHIVAPHYVYADLESMQVMTTLDESRFVEPIKSAVAVLVHLGFDFQDGVISDAPEIDA